LKTTAVRPRAEATTTKITERAILPCRRFCRPATAGMRRAFGSPAGRLRLLRSVNYLSGQQ
jgi:hypothetical protein